MKKFVFILAVFLTSCEGGDLERTETVEIGDSTIIEKEVSNYTIVFYNDEGLPVDTVYAKSQTHYDAGWLIWHDYSDKRHFSNRPFVMHDND